MKIYLRKLILQTAGMEPGKQYLAAMFIECIKIKHLKFLILFIYLFIWKKKLNIFGINS